MGPRKKQGKKCVFPAIYRFLQATMNKFWSTWWWRQWLCVIADGSGTDNPDCNLQTTVQDTVSRVFMYMQKGLIQCQEGEDWRHHALNATSESTVHRNPSSSSNIQIRDPTQGMGLWEPTCKSDLSYVQSISETWWVHPKIHGGPFGKGPETHDIGWSHDVIAYTYFFIVHRPFQFLSTS